MATTLVESKRSWGGRALAPLAAGSLVFVGLGIYGNVHDPTGRSLVTLFFTETITLKVWFATCAAALACFQLISALKIYGKLGTSTGPKWLGRAHRLSGTGAFLFTIPVAYHCLWALGLQLHSGTRILVHGVLGSFFFGAFAAKVLVVGWVTFLLLLAGVGSAWLTDPRPYLP